MSEVRLIQVSSDDMGLRLDRWFGRYFPKVGYGALQKLLRTGQVRVDGRRAKPNYRLSMGKLLEYPLLIKCLLSESQNGKKIEIIGPTVLWRNY